MKAIRLLFAGTMLFLLIQSVESEELSLDKIDPEIAVEGKDVEKTIDNAEENSTINDKKQSYNDPIIERFEKWISSLKTETCIALLALIVSLIFNWRMLNQAKDTHTFDAITRIHKEFNDKTIYDYRGLLFRHFGQGCWAELSNNYGITLFDSSNNEKVDIQNQLQILSDERLDSLKNAFEQKMKFPGIEYYFRADKSASLTYREVIETILTSFDYIAIPYYEKIKAAKSVAIAYRTIFDRTAPHILPFIAIEKMNRKNDQHYKFHYLNLLRGLGIPLRGVSVPPEPRC